MTNTIFLGNDTVTNDTTRTFFVNLAYLFYEYRLWIFTRTEGNQSDRTSDSAGRDSIINKFEKTQKFDVQR